MNKAWVVEWFNYGSLDWQPLPHLFKSRKLAREKAREHRANWRLIKHRIRRWVREESK